jgi:hypothetical protein
VWQSFAVPGTRVNWEFGLNCEWSRQGDVIGRWVAPVQLRPLSEVVCRPSRDFFVAETTGQAMGYADSIGDLAAADGNGLRRWS